MAQQNEPFFDAYTQTDALLFHPRRDVWNNHFRVDTDTAHIEGLTPTERATVLQLQINHLVQIAARRLWIEWHLSPDVRRFQKIVRRRGNTYVGEAISMSTPPLVRFTVEGTRNDSIQ